MKYAVNIAREFGENTIKTLFINSFTNENEWKVCIDNIRFALLTSRCSTEVNIIERDDEWKIAHIIFRNID